MFQIRNIICSCAAYCKILETGSGVFGLKSVLCLTLSAIGACLSSVFSPFMIDPNIIDILQIMITVFGAINIICFLYHSLQWINITRKIKYITTTQYICSVYVVMIFFAVSSFSVLSICYNTVIGPNTNTTYLCLYNYISATFIVTLIVLNVRMNRRDKEVAQDTLEEKRMFVRFVSHEVRTPLNTVFLGLKLLKEDFKSSHSTDNLLETLEEIQQSCDISLNILNDMLSFEKIESGRLVLEEESLNPKTLLEETIAPFSIQARNLGITLTVTYSPGCETELQNVTLFADKNKISQVIRNLVSNALKFTSRGGSVTVLVDVLLRSMTTRSSSKRKRGRRSSSTVGVTPSQKVLSIKVVDTGHGISEENIGKLFHPMVQFHAASHQGGGGTGLGLWIARAIVEKHRGTITAYSDGEGCGCSFTLKLQLQDLEREVPRTEPPQLNEHPFVEEVRDALDRNTVHLTDQHACSVTPIVELRTVETPFVGRFPCHVLVVDDSVSNRKMLVRLIRSRFLSVDEAEDGAQAVAKVRRAMKAGVEREGKGKGAVEGFQDDYNIILMDYMMPNMDGPTAARAIRELGFTGLIIGVTGKAQQGDIQYFHTSGANSVLIKPVDTSALMHMISNHFVQS